MVIWLQDCFLSYDCAFTCFFSAGCEDVEGNFYVLSRTVNSWSCFWFFNGRLAAILFDQQFLQAKSTDRNCKALIRNETLRCHLIIMEKERAIMLQAYMIWRLPFAKLAEFSSCHVVFLQTPVELCLGNPLKSRSNSWMMKGAQLGFQMCISTAVSEHRAKDLAGCMAHGYFYITCCGWG